MFPNKPPYQSMTSVCPLPSYMSGYLHQLGGHSSGVYRSDHYHGPVGNGWDILLTSCLDIWLKINVLKLKVKTVFHFPCP